MPEAQDSLRLPAMPRLALLAGGLATRMRPATLTVAKSMLPVAGEPFLGHQLRLLAAAGITQVVLCCGHLAEQLQAYAGDGSRWGLTLRYATDGPQPLGTGGALRNALPLLGDAFFVMYGDSYLRAPLAPIWHAFQSSCKPGLMTVYANAGRWDASNVHYEHGRILRYSKTSQTPAMRHIDYGLTCLRAEALFAWPAGARFDLAEVHAALLAQNALAACEVTDRFYEIGSPQGLADMRAHLAATSPASHGARI